MKNDIVSREDIRLLVETFYERIRRDAMLGPIFNETAAVDWDTHIPLLIDFWSTIVFSIPAYKGNPMQVHIELNAKTPLTKAHFDHWLEMFSTTVDDLFTGKTAEHIKQRAGHIAALMRFKVENAGNATFPNITH